MITNILQGDCLQTLATLDAGIVQTCVTSPPYYGLRDYGTASWEGGSAECDHVQNYNLKRDASGGVGGGRDKGTRGEQPSSSASVVGYRDICGKCGAIRIDSQIGLEESPEAYVEKLVAVFREVRRVLKDTGTIWLNLGDSYAGSGGYSPNSPSNLNGSLQSSGNTKGNRNKTGATPKLEGIKSKDLIGIPWMVAFALRADGWYLRSEIIWHKPNPMPESVTDRPTKSHEQIFLLSKSAHYFYDAEAIAEPALQPLGDAKETGQIKARILGQNGGTLGTNNGASTRNKRDVWTVNSQPYKEFHFATFPVKLIEPCILAGTSEKGECPKCGKAWVRVVEHNRLRRNELPPSDPRYRPNQYKGAYENINGKGDAGYSENITLGWEPQCKCPPHEPIPQTVLDPFNGSGTTGAVAIKHHRNYIGCELNPDYIELTNRRFAQVQPVLFTYAAQAEKGN